MASMEISKSDPKLDTEAIRDLVSRCESTITSLSNLLCRSSDDVSLDRGFCCCPFDSRHRMPPESLFIHWLRCASAPGGPIPDLGFLETTRYPKSLRTDEELKKENHFIRSIEDSGADLCFSLEKDLEDFGGSSFFYRNCPGVVMCTELEVSDRTFSLPRSIALECANFVSGRQTEGEISPKRSISVFPSEIWAFWREVEAWKNFPTSYSYIAVQIVSGLGEIGDLGFRKWILSNSPRFGIVIDGAMSDHLYLLLKVSLKAIWREALNSLTLVTLRNGFIDPRSPNFECPRLLEVMGWMASQLSILYGEINGRNLAISMITESLKRLSSSFLIFPLEKGGTSVETLERESGKVYVSQIASSVAALYERAMVEERVKQMRLPQPLSKIQLLHELSIVSTRAQEERSKRPNYRPLLEYDGLLSKKFHNQGNTRTKTAEELLAEERDYKRRRMSYRGKKVKRTSIQVTREIIEDHMREIAEAGGIGCHVGESAVSEIRSSTSSEVLTSDKRTRVTSDMAADAHPRDRSMSQGNYAGHARSHDHMKLGSHHRGHSYNSRSFKDFSENSPLSSTSLSTERGSERFRYLPERSKQSKQRNHDFRPYEPVAGVKFDDRYDPYHAS